MKVHISPPRPLAPDTVQWLDTILVILQAFALLALLSVALAAVLAVIYVLAAQ